MKKFHPESYYIGSNHIVQIFLAHICIQQYKTVRRDDYKITFSVTAIIYLQFYYSDAKFHYTYS